MEATDKITQTEVAVERLQKLIIDKEMIEGDKLPPEKELATELAMGVSRIREAILVLQTLGILNIVRGKGVFVTKRREDTSESTVHWFSEHAFQMGDFMEARMIIESTAAKLAVQRADSTDIEELQRIHDTFQKAVHKGDIVALVETDKAFHHTIIKASHNRILSIINHRIERAFEKYRIQAFALKKSRSNSLARHDAILSAFRERDPEAAQREMQHHLDVAYKDIPTK